MSRIRHSLTINTSLGSTINYTLQATIPSHMLVKCAAALPRPPWEPILYYITMCIMGFLLFCIMVTSYFEADRLFSADIMKRRFRSNVGLTFDRTQVFDLNKIAANVRAQQEAANSQTPSTPNGKSAPINRSNSSPGPLVESNGHVQPATRNSDSAISSIFILRMIKNLLSRWNAHREQRSTSGSNTSSRKFPDRHGAAAEKENKASNNTSTTPHNTKQHTMTDTCKSSTAPDLSQAADNNKTNTSVSSKQPNNKNKKGNKQRHQNDLITDGPNPSVASEKKQGNKNSTSTTTTNNNTIQRKLSSDTDHKGSHDKEKGGNALGVSHRRSSGASPVSHHLEIDTAINATDIYATKPDCEYPIAHSLKKTNLILKIVINS